MPITREKKLYHAMTLVTGAMIFATVIGTILSLYLHLFNTDKLLAFMERGGERVHLRFFKDNSITTAFIVLGAIVFLTFVAIAVILGIKSNKISQQTLPERRGALQFIRIFTGFTLLTIPVLYAIFSMNGFELGKFQGSFNLFAMILAVPGSLYFLFPGITDRFSEFLQIVFGICLIGFSVFSLVTTHVYMYEGLTSPIRACNILSLAAMMLFILFEVRFFASKALPNLYLACTVLAMYFCATNGIPRLFATVIGDMDVSLQTVYACTETMIAIYAICRAVIFLSEWKYTLQTATQASEDLPQSVSLNKESDPDLVEPDYTEDSDIESPILAAEIDLDLFDRAFSNTDNSTANMLETMIPSENTEEAADALEQMIPRETNENDDACPTDPLNDTELAEILQDLPNSQENSFEETSNDTEEPSSCVNSDDAFDTLSNEMFGSNS